jgi:peptidoglycan/LPS O-acetylase OafA/YrhL
MEETPRRIGRSILAILAGFLVVVILSIATDLLMHSIGLFPQLGQPITDKPLLIATAYRVIYAIIGSYITARLAPYQPMLHALWGGVIGLVLGIIGAVATWNRGPAFGPHWYPIALIVTALPCAWAGGKLVEKQASTQTHHW